MLYIPNNTNSERTSPLLKSFNQINIFFLSIWNIKTNIVDAFTCMHENYVYRKFWKRQKYRLQNSRFRKAGSAVSVILECEAREPHTGAASLTILPRRFFHTLQSFVRIWSVACVRKKIRLFCSLLKIVYSALTWSRVCKKWVQNKHLRDNRIIDHYKITEPLLALSLVTRLWRFRFARTFENYFIKVIEHFFHVYKTSSKHSGTGRILKSYANPRRSRGFAKLFGTLSTLVVYRGGYVNNEKSARLLN